MGFGPSKYMPGQIQSQPLGPVSAFAPQPFLTTEEMLGMQKSPIKYRNQNPDEEHMRMMQMLDSQSRPMPQQAAAPAQQMPANPIQAPKDRGMFGRFAGFNPLRFDPDKGVGQGNMLYAIGAGLAGMGTGDPGLTADLLEPKLQQNRDRVTARDEEAKRQQIAISMGLNPDLSALDLNAAIQAKQNAEAIERDDSRYKDTRSDRIEDIDWRNTRAEKEDKRWDMSWDREGDWREEDDDYRDTKDAEDARRWNVEQAARLAAAKGAKRQIRKGPDGIDRYVDNGEEVFPGITAAPEGGFKLANSLQGAPDSVINSVINDEDTRLTAAADKTASARKLSTLAGEFMKASEGYNSLGGGPLADVGQMFSQKTAELKGFTAQMIPMFRSAGEGPMTDPDAKRYELAATSINKGRGANEAALQVFKDFEADVSAYESFLRNYQETQGYGSMREAERLWNEYKTANPIFDPETGERNQRPDIYKWLESSQDVATEFDDDASIPEGAMVEDENGNRFRKQNGQLVRVMAF